MTSSNQMPNNIANLPRVETIITGSEARNHNSPPSDCPKAIIAKPAKLPYQANHQVELLHLHAEIEVLLQQVETLKRQRLITDEGSNLQMAEADHPVLAIR
ncbi:MAG TPA: hypothetical protein V6C57_10090 [Coleofasciculaceae cyanobacterium]